MKAFEEALLQQNIAFERNVPLAPHTSFRIGGNADYWVTAATVQQAAAVLAAAKSADLPLFVLGSGTNVLISDSGVAGVVLHLQGDGITQSGNTLTAFAGMRLSALCTAAMHGGLSGLEFAYGIPGSVGGAVYMNAGAYGGAFADVLQTVSFLTPDGQLQTLPAADLKFGYRTSVFKQNGALITAATITLQPGNPAEIKAEMDEIAARRREKQPLEWPSAGSAFKRPQDNFAGLLIEQCGLKGCTVGDAAVSEKHAGFIINKGAATAAEVRRLIALVQQTVAKKTGILLEPEVLFVGRDDTATEAQHVIL